MPAAAAPRLANAADVPQLSPMLARAFADDPVAMWTCRSAQLRPRVLERFHAARARQLITRGEVWVSDGLLSAAVWAAPNQWKTTTRDDIELTGALLQRASLRHPSAILRTPMIGLGLIGIEHRHPAKQPHWYLAVLGTEPLAQGRGLGSHVLSPVLRRCDSDGVGAYLESSNQANHSFYVRHGFRVTAEHRLPRGPTVWAMCRNPK